MQDLAKFLAAAGRWGVALMTGGLLSLSIAVYEHFGGSSLGAAAFAVMGSLAFILGGFLAWRDEHRKVVAEQERARESERRRLATVGSAEWLDLADRFKEISKFVGVQLTTASEGDREPVDTWRFSVEGDSEKCKALCERAGIMLTKSPNVAKQSSKDVLRAADAIDRWLCFLRDAGDVAYQNGYGREESEEGVVTLIYFGYIAEVAPISSRLCIECSNKEL